MSGYFHGTRAFLASYIGTDGVNGSAQIVKANADLPVYNFSARYDVAMMERRPARGTIITPSIPIPGARSVLFQFETDLFGSGTPGTASKITKLLQACGMAQTLLTGSFAIGTVNYNAASRRGGTIAYTLAIAGTMTTGTHSGTLISRVKSISTNTNVVMSHTFISDDGTVNDYEETTHTNTSAETFASTASSETNGLTAALSVSPAVATAGYRIGDEFITQITGEDTVAVKLVDDAVGAVLDMGLFYVDESRATRVIRAHSCKGSVRIDLRNGQCGRATFNFMGVSIDPAAGIVDGAGHTNVAAFDDVVPPKFLASTFTLGGVAVPCYSEISFDLGGALAMIECAGEASGFVGVVRREFTPTFTFNPIMRLAATSNPFTDWLAGTPAALQLDWGTTAGNKLRLSAPKFTKTGITDTETNTTMRTSIVGVCASPTYDSGADYSAVEYREL